MAFLLFGKLGEWQKRSLSRNKKRNDLTFRFFLAKMNHPV